MSKPVITVENLSKAYRIGLKEEVPDTLVSAMSGIIRAPFRKFRNLRKLDTFGHSGADEEDIYWALKDVSFEVKEGEVLGVIGRNGAGKSTLLKILSRITEPTSGRAVIRGRVSSLLEVGTGFHPELSGRENVYLNGTILGMTKREIDRKFDEIVDFSGIEKFLDTPIKRYSSGMKVRLAFAVAAHLEPEILIIDEVLAVGDAEFQKKCMGKMQDVARGGRTVMFVSHNLSAVSQLCSHGVVMQKGRVTCDARIAEALNHYTSSSTSEGMLNVGSGKPARIEAAFVCGENDSAGGVSTVIRSRRFELRLRVANEASEFDAAFGVSIESSTLCRVIANCSLHDENAFTCPHGNSEYSFIVPNLPLNQGMYFVTLALHRWHGGETLDRHEQCLSFQVVEPPSIQGKLSRRPNDGVVIVDCEWKASDL